MTLIHLWLNNILNNRNSTNALVPESIYYFVFITFFVYSINIYEDSHFASIMVIIHLTHSKQQLLFLPFLYSDRV